MTEGIREAKKRLIPNIVTNIGEVMITALVGLWLTSYFIEKIGPAGYAMIPLTSLIVRYFNLFLTILTSSIGRYVAIHLGKGNVEAGNMYFNSAFWGLLCFSFLSCIPAAVFACFLPSFLHVPEGLKTDTSLLFLCVILSALVTAMTSPFTVSTFITHRFALANTAKVAGRLLQLSVMVVLFSLLGPRLTFVGLGYLIMSAFLLVFYINTSGRLTPELKIDRTRFRWNTFREMAGMGTWTLIDEIGTMLYLSTDLIVINILMGADQQGRYAALLQLVVLLRLLAPAISSVFAPVAIDLIAKDRYDALIRQTVRAIKYLGLFYALLAGLLCGFAAPLLRAWLGDSFRDLSLLLILMSFPQILFLPINPLYNINRGLNKVRTPALVTLIGGLVNIVLSVVLVRYTSLGLYGVCLAMVISYGARSILFTPVYTGMMLKERMTTFLRPVSPGILGGSAVGACAWLIGRYTAPVSLAHLVFWGMVVALIYAPFCYFLFLDPDDRCLLRSVFHRYGTVR